MSRRERARLWASIDVDLAGNCYGDSRIRMSFATSDDRWTTERWTVSASRSRADEVPSWLVSCSPLEIAQWTVAACDAVAAMRAVDARFDVGRSGCVWSPGYLGTVEVEPGALHSPVFRAWCDAAAGAHHPHDLVRALRESRAFTLCERWAFRAGGAEPVAYDAISVEDRRPSVAWSHGPELLRARAVLAEHEAERLRTRAAEAEADRCSSSS